MASSAAVTAQLLYAMDTGDGARWREVGNCPGEVCSAGQRVRVEVDSLGFPHNARSVAIEALFATASGTHGFRLACYRADAVSPCSKPFGFELQAGVLSGFRVLFDVDAASDGRVGILPLVPASLAPGRYLLLADDQDRLPRPRSIAVPTATREAVRLRGERPLPATHLAFSIHALDA